MSYPVRVYGFILNQSLSQYWTVLQMCVTFCEHQITQPNYTVTHACPVGPHENASMAEYSLHQYGRSWHTVHAVDETLQTFELVIAKDGLDTGIRQCRNRFSRYMGGLEK